MGVESGLGEWFVSARLSILPLGCVEALSCVSIAIHVSWSEASLFSKIRAPVRHHSQGYYCSYSDTYANEWTVVDSFTAETSFAVLIKVTRLSSHTASSPMQQVLHSSKNSNDSDEIEATDGGKLPERA